MSRETSKYTSFQWLVIALPLIFSLFYTLAVYFGVFSESSAITPYQYGLARGRAFHFLILAGFIFIPNLILSYLLYLYADSHIGANLTLLALCASGIISGMIPVWSIYVMVDISYVIQETGMTVILFGLPFTYLFGMGVGYFICHLMITSFTRDS